MRFEPQAIRMDRFARVIAKIAHSHTIALRPSIRFIPLLPDVILGKVTDWHRVIGGVDANVPHDAKYVVSYGLGVRDVSGVRYLAAQLRFFADRGSPTYEAVVGEILS